MADKTKKTEAVEKTGKTKKCPYWSRKTDGVHVVMQDLCGCPSCEEWHQEGGSNGS